MKRAKEQLRKHLTKRFPHMSDDERKESVENLLAFAEVITNDAETVEMPDTVPAAVLTDSRTSSRIKGNQ